ncbi:hypothetical protein EV363DRAFT_1230926 [Boletus edulis]|uniref:Uncharacterized protein n=1 Tax=Boletus edulis BED1 TaxID=1328754 RepID=A0AAD4BQ24_BOLED|nr:hypothetical protein EV363DRAFT_1230926 [Boletus edulis]KAF8436307.1 hypothetical protein L210DRAFT_3549372 [Boletus edulis BED1]
MIPAFGNVNHRVCRGSYSIGPIPMYMSSCFNTTCSQVQPTETGWFQDQGDGS